MKPIGLDALLCARAAQLEGAAGAAGAQLVDRGVLGIACVFLLIAIGVLWRALSTALRDAAATLATAQKDAAAAEALMQDRYIDLVVKTTDVLAQNTVALRAAGEELQRARERRPPRGP